MEGVTNFDRIGRSPDGRSTITLDELGEDLGQSGVGSELDSIALEESVADSADAVEHVLEVLEAQVVSWEHGVLPLADGGLVADLGSRSNLGSGRIGLAARFQQISSVILVALGFLFSNEVLESTTIALELGRCGDWAALLVLVVGLGRLGNLPGGPLGLDFSNGVFGHDIVEGMNR